MKGFGIEIKNDLLEPKHIEKMGVAVWLYMWCIDKITRIEDDGLGWVLGGKPITYQDVQEELGIPLRTYRRWVSILKGHGYLVTTQNQKGLTIKVNKAYKHFNKGYARNGTSEVPKPAVGSAENGTSLSIQLQRQNSKTGVGFEKFWTLYPKKVDKKKSEAKWNRLTKGTQETILADLPRRAKTEQWQKGYVPNPTTYLNGERWNDEIKASQQTSSGPAMRNFTQERLAEENRAPMDGPGRQKFDALKKQHNLK